MSISRLHSEYANALFTINQTWFFIIFCTRSSVFSFPSSLNSLAIEMFLAAVTFSSTEIVCKLFPLAVSEIHFFGPRSGVFHADIRGALTAEINALKKCIFSGAPGIFGGAVNQPAVQIYANIFISRPARAPLSRARVLIWPKVLRINIFQPRLMPRRVRVCI